jgi:hypothetical protein
VIPVASSLGSCLGVSRQWGLVEEAWGQGGGVLGRGLQTEWVVVGEERVYGIGDGTGILVFFPIRTGGGAVQVGEMESGVIGMAHPGEKERDQKVREGLRKGIANRIFLISCLI